MIKILLFFLAVGFAALAGIWRSGKRQATRLRIVRQPDDGVQRHIEAIRRSEGYPRPRQAFPAA